MQTAKQIEQEIYEQAMKINNNLSGSCFSLHIDEQDLYDLQDGETLHIDVEIKLTTV